MSVHKHRVHTVTSQRSHYKTLFGELCFSYPLSSAYYLKTKRARNFIISVYQKSLRVSFHLKQKKIALLKIRTYEHVCGTADDYTCGGETAQCRTTNLNDLQKQYRTPLLTPQYNPLQFNVIFISTMHTVGAQEKRII